MTKQQTKQPNPSWAIYHVWGISAQFIGIVYDAHAGSREPIKKAIEEFKVPANQHDRLVAQRRV
jgi:hypothetical protein